ncbi:MAG: helix-turn-helix domain-containing protein [Pseudomonadota bacterium]|nr:helix-turn-helix domain-containing protein [Pseudomonadota bacterium]
MKLKNYLQCLSTTDREAFAKKLDSSTGHLQNVAYGYRPCAPALAVALERETGGAVSRQELRDDWQNIWPELVAPTPSTPNTRTRATDTQPTSKA